MGRLCLSAVNVIKYTLGILSFHLSCTLHILERENKARLLKIENTYRERHHVMARVLVAFITSTPNERMGDMIWHSNTHTHTHSTKWRATWNELKCICLLNLIHSAYSHFLPLLPVIVECISKHSETHTVSTFSAFYVYLNVVCGCMWMFVDVWVTEDKNTGKENNEKWEQQIEMTKSATDNGCWQKST